jgi:di/tricarboxylate transporter
MTSRRTTLIVYSVVAIWLIGGAIFMVTFPEMADRVAIVLEGIVIAAGIGFVVAGLFRRDLSLLVIGAGFLMGMIGDNESIRWMSFWGGPIACAGIVWHIKKTQASRA